MANTRNSTALSLIFPDSDEPIYPELHQHYQDTLEKYALCWEADRAPLNIEPEHFASTIWMVLMAIDSWRFELEQRNTVLSQVNK